MSYTIADLRAHLVSCFEPACRIIGNTTQRAIVDAIDAALDGLRNGERVCAELVAERDALEVAAHRSRCDLLDAQAECERLTALINTPQTTDFVEAVKVEAAHQVERWGVNHDAGKRAEDWIALVVYLLGKATKAHYERDGAKLLHHVITLAAVALNWHRNMMGESTLMRPGIGDAP